MTDEQILVLDAKIIRHVLLRQTFLMPAFKAIAALLILGCGLAWVWSDGKDEEELGFERSTL